MITRRFTLFLVLWCALTPGFSQPALSDPDPDAWAVYDRMIVLSGGGSLRLHAGIRPLFRPEAVAVADSFGLVSADRVSAFQRQWIYNDNNDFVRPSGWPEQPDARYRLSRRPVWKTFFRTPAHLLEVDEDDISLRIDPLLQVGLGREREEDVNTFINQRGLRIRGRVGRNVYFQTSFYDAQVRYPNYVNTYTDAVGVVPGVGLYKNYDSSLFQFSNGRDYLLATGYVGAVLGKHFDVQLGHNQHFIGEGIRSLLLSDFSTPFFSVRLNTRVWKLQYQNIFAEMAADDFLSVNGTSEPVDKKFMAAHYLSFRASRHVTLGLFESVIFDRDGDHFEWQYINPVILYRSVEGTIGSPDNVLLGFNARVEVARRFKFYGQVILDDLQLGQILKGNRGWWGNKYGFQLGATYYNALGIDHLDMQAEWNRVRPFTYSHYNAEANYAHYNQALAHPLGANFNEWIGSIRYQPLPRLVLQGQVYVIRSGEDRDSVSYGGNILVPNTQRVGDYDNQVGQGVSTRILFLRGGAMYSLLPGLTLDLFLTLRSKRSDLVERDQQTQQVRMGLRYNLARREDVF